MEYGNESAEKSSEKQFVNFRCPMCGKFLSKRGVLFMGRLRGWVLLSSANPNGRKSMAFNPRQLVEINAEFLKLYRTAIYRLIINTVEQGVISTGNIESLAASLREYGPEKTLARIEHVLVEKSASPAPAGGKPSSGPPAGGSLRYGAAGATEIAKRAVRPTEMGARPALSPRAAGKGLG